MKLLNLFSSGLIGLSFIGCPTAPKATDPRVLDRYEWLHELRSDASMKWVEAKNKSTLDILTTDARYEQISGDIRSILSATDRIPFPTIRGGFIYNFWQDTKNVRGLWRKTTVQEYRKSKPKWDVLIDLDALAKKENENWVWKGAFCLPPPHARCMVKLSQGGIDASVFREFDVETKRFLNEKTDNGFFISEAKSQFAWINENEVLVGTNFGKDSLTQSGYPRIIKKWKRGTPLQSAETVYEGKKEDAWVGVDSYFQSNRTHTVISRGISFYESEEYLWVPQPDKTNSLKRIEAPKDVQARGFFRDQYLVLLRSPWTTATFSAEAGSLVGISAHDFTPELILPFSKNFILEQVEVTQAGIAIVGLDQVKSKLIFLTPNEGTQKGWKNKTIELPKNGTLGISSASAYDPIFYVSFESHIKPVTLFEINKNIPAPVKSLPERFDTWGIISEQFFATSKDGTQIPYFLTRNKKSKLDGTQPTILYGYGGFEYSQQPTYLGAIGKVWTEQGGVWVEANIRGGGEFGPSWHQAALKEKRQIAFDDFIAVAEDLIRRKITSPKNLGIVGGSNGGLLVGAAFTQRPDLFKAVVCQVPLLDMLVYPKLLAGASWIAEYGDPEDPKMKEILLKYSPYHNLKAVEKYPSVFFITSTGDDRVHPAHARKMAALMEEQGHPHLYFENTEGGHSAAANIEQRVKRNALQFTFFTRELR